MEIIKGVSYHKIQRPNLTYHLVTIDKRKVEFVVTTAKTNELKLLTTSEWANPVLGIVVAINGDQFKYLDKYTAAVDGTAASRGRVYNRSKSEPTIYIDRKGNLSTKKPLLMFDAISGNHVLVDKGNIPQSLDKTRSDPRTIVGWNYDYSV